MLPLDGAELRKWRTLGSTRTSAEGGRFEAAQGYCARRGRGGLTSAGFVRLFPGMGSALVRDPYPLGDVVVFTD